ncbi:hypothetical protein AQJ30_07395 [Streptomyces longwoodensis]|uniref:Uncharacterized protein n=1 Tax=Streptomyces longwoodensis TaxID=68231 RepID=A0A101R2S7_9ACTN|nr:hypothetical protein AQJ30_07395 [Streptomyces longwoodensis]
MAGVIVFLAWLWISNLTILLGLEFDAETARQQAIAGGHPPEAEPYTQPRDTRKWSDGDRRHPDKLTAWPWCKPFTWGTGTI